MKPNSKFEIRNSKQVEIRNGAGLASRFELGAWALAQFRAFGVSDFDFRPCGGRFGDPAVRRLCDAAAEAEIGDLSGQSDGGGSPADADGPCPECGSRVGQRPCGPHVPCAGQEEARAAFSGPSCCGSTLRCESISRAIVTAVAKAVILGSNEEEFWLALRPKEISSYYIGRWQDVRDFEGLVMSPRVVLEAVGIRDRAGRRAECGLLEAGEQRALRYPDPAR